MKRRTRYVTNLRSAATRTLGTLSYWFAVLLVAAAGMTICWMIAAFVMGLLPGGA